MFINTLVAVTESQLSSGNLPSSSADPAAIQNVLSIAFVIIGALALLMITVSGLRYVLSAGDPQKISQAKNSIIYSLVGLAVAIAAEAIVHFVLGKI
jgi:hypothetical protein